MSHEVNHMKYKKKNSCGWRYKSKWNKYNLSNACYKKKKRNTKQYTIDLKILESAVHDPYLSANLLHIEAPQRLVDTYPWLSQLLV